MLKEKGIEIPGPDPKYQKLESLLEGLVLDTSTRVDPSDLPLKEGTPVVVLERVYPSEPEKRSDKLIQIGVVGKDVFNFKDKNRVIPGKPFFSVEYHHFTPDEQHATGVFNRDSHVFTSEYSRNVFTIPKDKFYEIAQEAGIRALPESESEYGRWLATNRLLRH